MEAGSPAVAADLTSTVMADSPAPLTEDPSGSGESREECEADTASVSPPVASDIEPPPREQPDHLESVESAVAPAAPVSETIVAAEQTLDRMQHLLEEVRGTMSDHATDAAQLVESVCDEKALHEHAPELDRLLGEFLGTDEPAADAAPTAEVSADDALAAVESAMSALTDATTTEPAIAAGEAIAAEAADQTDAPDGARADADAAAPPAADASASEPTPEIQADPQPERQPEAAAAEEAPAATEATPVASPAPADPSAVAVAAQAAVAVAAQASSAPTAAPTPVATTPKPSLAVSVRHALATRTAAVSVAVRSALTVLANVVPAKLRMIVGIAAATMVVWVPVVWMMAGSVAANDRIRALTPAELRELVESTTAAGESAPAAKSEGHGEKKGEKKEAGHEKKAEKKDAKKEAGHEKKAEGGHEEKKAAEKKPAEKKAEKKPEKKDAKKEGGHEEKKPAKKESGGH